MKKVIFLKLIVLFICIFPKLIYAQKVNFILLEDYFQPEESFQMNFVLDKDNEFVYYLGITLERYSILGEGRGEAYDSLGWVHEYNGTEEATGYPISIRFGGMSGYAPNFEQL